MASPSPSTKLVLEPNVPQLIALKYSTGKIVESRFGDEKQVYFSLADGRAFYASLGLGQSINNLQLGNREPFWICKRWNGSKTQTPRYDVWLTPEGEKARADQEVAPPVGHPATLAVPVEEPSLLERQLAASIHEAQTRRQPESARASVSAPAPASANTAAPITRNDTPHRATKLEDALKTVVAAVHEAQQYAKQIGFAMPQFTAEDIRTMANTLIIDSQRSAGGQR